VPSERRGLGGGKGKGRERDPFTLLRTFEESIISFYREKKKGRSTSAFIAKGKGLYPQKGGRSAKGEGRATRFSLILFHWWEGNCLFFYQVGGREKGEGKRGRGPFYSKRKKSGLNMEPPLGEGEGSPYSSTLTKRSRDQRERRARRGSPQTTEKKKKEEETFPVGRLTGRRGRKGEKKKREKKKPVPTAIPP